MITPVYMPFTCIGRLQRRLIGACFDRIEIYQPLSGEESPEMRHWMEEGFLTLRNPGPGDDDNLRELVKAYRNWDALHQDHSLSYLKAIQSKIPFFDDTLPSSIRTAIKNYGQPQDRSMDRSPHIRARLFLQMAHEHDLHHLAVLNDLEAVKLKERALHQSLHDETAMPHDQPITGAAPDENGRDFMVAERLAAWAVFPLLCGKFPEFWVTTSEAVCDHFMEIWDRMDRVASLPGIPLHSKDTAAGRAWRKTTAKRLEQYMQNTGSSAPLVEIPEPPENSQTDSVNLTIFHISHPSPGEFYRSWSKLTLDSQMKAGQAARQHTILALVRKQKELQPPSDAKVF